MRRLMTSVGFIGLGQIGTPDGEAGSNAPVVFDVRPEATEGFGDVASSVAEVAERADVISVMVRDENDVREVVDELLPAAQAGTIVAIHSTISRTAAVALADSAGPFDVAVVDAPVSGGAIGAHEGTLVVMVGGPADVADRCREAFAPWSSLFVHTGPVGSATTMKIARNLITFASFAAAGEAQRLAAAAGLDLKMLGNVVRHSDRSPVGRARSCSATQPSRSAETTRGGRSSNTPQSSDRRTSRWLSNSARTLDVDLPLAELALEHIAAALGVKA